MEHVRGEGNGAKAAVSVSVVLCGGAEERGNGEAEERGKGQKERKEARGKRGGSKRSDEFVASALSALAVCSCLLPPTYLPCVVVLVRYV